MSKQTQEKTAALVPVLVAGISLNTLGIVLQRSIGAWSFLFMGVGIALILTFLVVALRARGEVERRPDR